MTAKEAGRALRAGRRVFAVVGGRRVEIIAARMRRGHLYIEPLHPAPSRWVEAEADSLEAEEAQP